MAGKKVGRPSKYTKDLLIKAQDYIYNFEANNAYDKENPNKFREEFPTVVGLAVYCKVGQSTIYDWLKEEDKKEFSDIIKAIEQIQELYLLNKSIIGAYNPTIAKVLLVKFGHSDKQQIEHSGGIDLQHLSDDELRKIAEED